MSSQEGNSNQQTYFQLGDIIAIEAPTNLDLHDRVFLIKYLDSEQITIVDEENMKEIVLSVGEDGNLLDSSIEAIAIGDRADDPGYARQNNLLPGQWINLHFGGDMPAVITGKITDLDEDMIEIETADDKERIYIDFAYKGIPKNLPLDKIEIRDRPDSVSMLPGADGNVAATKTEADASDVSDDADADTGLGADDEDLIAGPEFEVPVADVKAQIKEMFISADEITFGADMGIVEQEVQRKESQQRFSVDKQRDDMLDELLSTIPNAQRTQSVLDNVNNMIERFIRLRDEFSVFDAQGNAEKAKVHGAEHKPLLDHLLELNANIHWLLPIAQNKKYLYEVESPEETGMDDYLSVTLNEQNANIENIMNDFHNDSAGIARNKYDFLISELSRAYTPFETSAIAGGSAGGDDSGAEGLSDGSGILITKQVNTNLTAVIDNLQDFYSSVKKGANLNRARFLITKYELGLNRLRQERLRNGKDAVVDMMVTEPQRISISGMVTLPKQFANFARATMPRTNIMVQSNLARHYLNYWKILRNNTFVSNTIVDSLENEVSYDHTSFMKGVRSFMLSESIDEEDKYKKFLECILPRTRVLFELVKRQMEHAYSLHGILEYLEPFYVYHKDLSFKQYEAMTSFVRKEVGEYKKRLATMRREFSAVDRFNMPGYFTPQLYDLIENPRSNLELLRDPEPIFYEYLFTTHFEDGEIFFKPKLAAEQLQQMIITDNARALTSALSMNMVDLMVPDESLLEEVNEDLIEAKRELRMRMNESACGEVGKYVVAKKYLSREEMDDDTETDVYFDRQLDKTDYKFLKKYEREQKDMGSVAFLPFLTSEIQKAKPSMSTGDAEREAAAMIEGRRLVQDGDFAVLQTEDEFGNQKLQNFARNMGQWVPSDVQESLLPTLNLGALCAAQEECIPIAGENGKEPTCIPTDSVALKQEASALAESIQFFAELYPKQRAKMTSYISKRFDDSFRRLVVTQDIRFKNQEKYDKQRYALGQSSEKYEVVESPYAPLRDLILGQGDFVKKQYDILRFCQKFTYDRPQAEEPSESAWLYCNVSDAKLIPTFLHTLASAFVYDADSYLVILGRICNEIGTESDDGENWVDKYTGYIIRPKEFDIEEGFTQQGFKVQTRATMEEDLGNAIFLNENKKRSYTSAEAEKSAAVANALGNLMGINILPREDFIVRNVVVQHKKTMPNKANYDKLMAKKQAKQEKKIKIVPYEEASNANIVYLTFAYYLVAIQTAIPSLTSNKTFPGCKTAFGGYPLEGNADKGGLKYIACLAQSLKKTKAEPWNAIRTASEATIIKKTETLIDMLILKDPEMIATLDEKRAYMTEQAKQEVPLEHDVRKWTNFMPPLLPPKVEKLQPLADDFKQKFISHLKQGNVKQADDIYALQMKVKDYAVGMMELIQKAVSADRPIMTNAAMEAVGFVQNACCETRSNDAYDYFAAKQPDLSRYNTVVAELTKLLDAAGLYAKAPMLYDASNTKLLYPALPKGFAQDTIMRAYIHYCRYDSVLPVPGELLEVCQQKPDGIQHTMSVNDIVTMLKESGRVYTKEGLDMLMSIVNRRNMVKLNLEPTVITKVQELRDVLETYNAMEEAPIDKAVAKKLFDILDVFSMEGDESSTEVRELRNMLAALTEENLTEVSDFVSRNGALKNKGMKKSFNEFMKDGFSMLATSPNALVSAEDNAVHRSVQLTRNMGRSLTEVIPGMVMNSVDATTPTIPIHWGLTPAHRNDLTNLFVKYYSALGGFYGDNSVRLAVEEYHGRVKPLMELLDNLVFLAPKPGSDVASVLDARTVELICKYVMSVIFKMAMESSENEQALMVNLSDAVANDKAIGTFEDVMMNAYGDVTALELIAVEKKQLAQKIARLIVVMANMQIDHKASVDFSYESTMERVLKIKRRERDAFAHFADNMTDEEKQIELNFKQAKLGRWGLGLQKGLTQYVGENYDRERENDEAEMILRIKTQNMGMGMGMDVNDRNIDIVMAEMAQRNADIEDIERDAYDLSMVGEDNDDGFDPDE